MRHYERPAAGLPQNHYDYEPQKDEKSRNIEIQKFDFNTVEVQNLPKKSIRAKSISDLSEIHEKA